jgi:hypothetical protein
VGVTVELHRACDDIVILSTEDLIIGLGGMAGHVPTSQQMLFWLVFVDGERRSCLEFRILGWVLLHELFFLPGLEVATLVSSSEIFPHLVGLL